MRSDTLDVSGMGQCRRLEGNRVILSILRVHGGYLEGEAAEERRDERPSG